MPRIYTFGYSKKTVSELKRLAKEKGALVIDVRLKPYSRWQQEWSIGPLRTALGDLYRWYQWFGNLGYKTNRTEIADMDTGAQRVKKHIDAGRSVILLCACADPNTCHRSAVAEELARRFNLEVEHLGTDRKPHARQLSLFS